MVLQCFTKYEAHRQAKVSPQTPFQNFLIYGYTATCSLTLRNIRQAKPSGLLRKRSGEKCLWTKLKLNNYKTNRLERYWEWHERRSGNLWGFDSDGFPD